VPTRFTRRPRRRWSSEPGLPSRSRIRTRSPAPARAVHDRPAAGRCAASMASRPSSVTEASSARVGLGVDDSSPSSARSSPDGGFRSAMPTWAPADRRRTDSGQAESGRAAGDQGREWESSLHGFSCEGVRGRSAGQQFDYGGVCHGRRPRTSSAGRNGFPLARMWCTMRVIKMAPDAPRGARRRSRRRAGLSLAWSAPVSAAQARGTLANAALTSKVPPMSSMVSPAPLEHLRGGGDRRGQHGHRVGSGHRAGVEPGQRAQAELGRSLSGGDQQGRAAGQRSASCCPRG